MSDDELVAKMKRQLREGLWTPKDRMELKNNVKAWENKYATLLEQSEALFKRDRTRGKSHIETVCDGLKSLIHDVVLTRAAFDGEAGYTDMYDMCQEHIDQLLKWKSHLEGLIGIGLN